MYSRFRNFVILTIAIISSISFSSFSFADSKGFTDVDSSNPYAPYIQDLQSKGSIDGTGSGKFNPTGVITRAQFVKLLVTVVNLPLDKSPSHFSDVDGHWASNTFKLPGLMELFLE